MVGWGDGGGGQWLVRMEWRLAGWLVCLPLLTFSCTIKSKVLFWHRLTRVGPEKGRKTVVVVVVRTALVNLETAASCFIHTFIVL